MTILRKSKTIELSDGTKIVVREAAFDETARLVESEQGALAIIRKTRDGQAEVSALDFRRDYFMVKVYPKLQGCSSAFVEDRPLPTVDEAFEMPTTELNKWYGAARELNPDWFAEFDEAVEKLSEEEKKKDRGKRPDLRKTRKAGPRPRK